ncbi:MAG TPA: NAD(P)/FAD-dependent oxidoreductase [Gemmatimonadota bacterium]|nr:NAD(P)/FAD-dependent oxidoreductase [Gemmatimonadota bacterium]
MTTPRPRVLVLGGGFGGLQCARKLARKQVDVLLVDRNNYHLFTPLLYQVASSLLNPSEISFPLRHILRRRKNVRVRRAEVAEIDLAARRAVTVGGHAFEYDWLVIATGAETNFYGIESVEQASFGLKDLPDGMALRNHVLDSFEAALLEPDPLARRSWLTFLVVGGGPTGVEYAGALCELFRLVLPADFPDLDVGSSRVILVEALDRLLFEFPAALGEYTKRALERRGVEVRLGTRVTGVEGDGAVLLADGGVVSARTLIWAAGVRPIAPATEPPLPRTRQGRIEVDENLRVRGQERVFAIGDAAAMLEDGKPLAMMAPQAMQAGRHVAAQILRAVEGRALEPFRYRDKGVMATIGRSAGVAAVGPLRLKGFIGWIAWLVIHLYFLIGFRNRLIVLSRWTYNYFRLDRPIRLIASSAPSKRRRTVSSSSP